MFRVAFSISKSAKLNRGTARCISLTPSFSFPTSSEAAASSKEENRVVPVYVHHVSKTVLHHLQDSKADWLVKSGLDRGLHVNQNGTISIRFPSRPGFDSGRIWTSYDSGSQQHWISVYRYKLKLRFLLRDATSDIPAKSSEEIENRVRRGVNDMVEAIEMAETARSQRE